MQQQRSGQRTKFTNRLKLNKQNWTKNTEKVMCLHTRYSYAKIQSWKIQKTMKIIDFLHISTNPADWVDKQKNITVKNNFFNHLFNKNVGKFFLLRKKQLNLRHYSWYLAELTSCRFNWHIFYYHKSFFLITWLQVCFLTSCFSVLQWFVLESTVIGEAKLVLCSPCSHQTVSSLSVWTLVSSFETIF